MESDREIAEYWHNELIEGLNLIASTYEIQQKVLPDFIHLPDEVLDALPVDSLGSMLKYELISEVQLKEIESFDKFLEEVKLPSDYDDMLEEMRSGSQFKTARELAKKLLYNLGYGYKEPKINTIYINGS